jgi:cysteine desulfurase
VLSLGLTPREAKGVVRFSLSRRTTEDEIARVLEIVPRAVADSRAARSTGTRPATVPADA